MDIDNSWINTFKSFNQFYKIAPSTITLFLLYVNKKREVHHVSHIPISMTNSTVSKEKIVEYINRYNTDNRYRLVSIASFNYTAEPDDVLNENIMNNSYFKTHQSIEDIHFANTIEMFHDVNALYFIYREKNQSKTKTIHMKKNRKTRKKV